MFFYYLVKLRICIHPYLLGSYMFCEVKNIMTKIPLKGRLR